jgi:hypothetical protein
MAQAAAVAALVADKTPTYEQFLTELLAVDIQQKFNEAKEQQAYRHIGNLPLDAGDVEEGLRLFLQYMLQQQLNPSAPAPITQQEISDFNKAQFDVVLAQRFLNYLQSRGHKHKDLLKDRVAAWYELIWSSYLVNIDEIPSKKRRGRPPGSCAECQRKEARIKELQEKLKSRAKAATLHLTEKICGLEALCKSKDEMIDVLKQTATQKPLFPPPKNVRK